MDACVEFKGKRYIFVSTSDVPERDVVVQLPDGTFIVPCETTEVQIPHARRATVDEIADSMHIYDARQAS